MTLLEAALVLAVAFPGGTVVQVPLSDPGPDDLFTPARPTVRYNRDRTAAAVNRCVFGPVNADWCDLALVKWNGEVRPLWRRRDGAGLFWTPDGQYLVAWSETSLRLWNLRGRVRGLIPDLPLKAGQRIFSRKIQKVWLQGGTLCLWARLTVGPDDALAPVLPDERSDRDVNALTTSSRLLAYDWPTLAPKAEAACRRP